MMHRTLSLIVLMASLAATAGTISKTYNFSSSQVEVNSVSTDNGSRSMVTYNGLGNTTDIGAPSIPVKSVLFKVPDNAINISVSAQTSDAISISLPDSIYYVPAVTTSGGVAMGAAIQKTIITNTNTDSEIRAGDLLSSSLYNTTESNGLKEYYIKTLVGDPLCRLFVHQPLILEAVENTADYNGEYRTYNVNSGNAKLHVGRAPIEDATYAYRNTASNTHTDSIKNYTNTVTCVYTAGSAPQILPLYLENSTIWQYSSPYIFADDVFIGNTSGGGADNMFIAPGAEVTIEALGDVNIGGGLYIQHNATLNIIADGTVSLDEIHMGENATLNITAWDILNDSEWANNDGSFNYSFTKHCIEVQIAASSKAMKTASDYTPMVVEGKTWWQSTERWPDRYKREHYYYYEVGFTIGSKVEIDGVTWNKLYISHYRDGVNYIDGIKWNEDESLLGYIREEDGKILTLMGSLAEKKERYASLFGETYAILCPMYPVDGKETLIYDFNKRDFHIGSLGYESNPSDYDLEPFLLKYVSEDLVNNSGGGL